MARCLGGEDNAGDLAVMAGSWRCRRCGAALANSLEVQMHIGLYPTDGKTSASPGCRKEDITDENGQTA